MPPRTGAELQSTGVVGAARESFTALVVLASGPKPPDFRTTSRR